MKKIILILITITLFSVLNDLSNTKVTIPKESIRFRVIANSDKDKDIYIKKQVAKNLKKEVFKTLANTKNIEDSRNNILNNMDKLKENVDNTLKENNCNMKYEINYGQNYFPIKEYKNVLYKEGNYESLVVKIGKGEGKNFWCVLFPPLCFVDEKNNKNIEYHLLVKDIINKYLQHK